MSQTTTRIKANVKTRVDPDAVDAQSSGTTRVPVGTPDNPSNRVLTVANLITLCRFVLTVIFLVMFVNKVNRPLALTCYAVAAVTDFLDGQVARRTQTVSWLGKIMDPVMDRVLLFTGVLGLMVTGELPVWVAAFVILRDAYLFVGAMIVQRYRRRPVDVIYAGKAATACLMAGFVDMLLGIPRLPALSLTDVGWLPGLNDQPAALGVFLVYLGVVLSAITAVAYTRTGVRIRRNALAGREGGESR